jgi:hypothetical protein
MPARRLRFNAGSIFAAAACVDDPGVSIKYGPMASGFSVLLEPDLAVERDIELELGDM